MKVRTILLSMVLVAGVSLNVSAQFKIGGKSIITKKFRAILCIFFLDKRRCGRSILCQEEMMKFSKK